MRFFLFILVNAMLFIRPAELLPWLGEFQIYLVCILACFLVSWPAILELARNQRRFLPPIVACALGLLVAIPISDVGNNKTDETFDHTFDYFKVMIYLVLLVSLVNTPER